MIEDRIVVTGMGIISAIGIGKEATLSSLRKGESGVEEIKYLESQLKEYPAGEVKLSNKDLAKLAGLKYPESELRTVSLGIIAVKEALHQSGLTIDESSNTAFINGTTVGGMDLTERHFEEVFTFEGESEHLPEMCYNDCGCSTQLIADATGRYSLITTPSTACSSAANAIMQGADLIKAGICERAVVGGTEALSRFHYNGFNTLMILDRKRCRPFSEDRAGINLGEGAAYLVLEKESDAKARGAKILGMLSGYGNACDAFHQTATSEDGEGAFLSMSEALKMADISPEQIDYINCHGTGTPNNDITELAAMRRIWSDRLPPFSSTKPFTGHTTSASGAIEAVISLMVINDGFIPKNLGFSAPIHEGCSPVISSKENANVKYVLDNSFGFGGNDSSLIFSRYE